MYSLLRDTWKTSDILLKVTVDNSKILHIFSLFIDQDLEMEAVK